jgi:hypothetical protein
MTANKIFETALIGLLACIAFSSPTSAATFTLAELAAGQTFTIGSVEFVDWVFENPTVNLDVARSMAMASSMTR